MDKPVSHFVAGHLALDFCNTAGEHLSAAPTEKLVDWPTFIRWSVQASMVPADLAVELARRSESVGTILELREAVFMTGVALTRASVAPARALALIRQNADAQKPPVKQGKDGLRWWPHPAKAAAQLSAVLASEALSLFCSSKASKIGICEGGDCGWLFIDDSRGKRRRWCDMNDCGARAKARRYYLTHKQS